MAEHFGALFNFTAKAGAAGPTCLILVKFCPCIPTSQGSGFSQSPLATGFLRREPEKGLLLFLLFASFCQRAPQTPTTPTSTSEAR